MKDCSCWLSFKFLSLFWTPKLFWIILVLQKNTKKKKKKNQYELSLLYYWYSFTRIPLPLQAAGFPLSYVDFCPMMLEAGGVFSNPKYERFEWVLSHASLILIFYLFDIFLLPPKISFHVACILKINICGTDEQVES